MQTKLFVTKEDFSKKEVNLKVILSLSYNEKILEFYINILTKENKEKNIIEFNFNDLIESLILKFDKDFLSNFIISYYFKNDTKEGNRNKNISQNDKILIDNKITIISPVEKNKTTEPNSFFVINLEDYDNKTPHFMKLPKDLTIYLNFRQKFSVNNPFGADLLENEANNDNLFSFNIDIYNEKKKNSNGRRDKEKTIYYAIIKVFQWLKIREKYGKTSLEAAEIIGMKKKTLEGYHSQIIKGMNNNFNFRKHIKKRFNVLRKFNK